MPADMHFAILSKLSKLSLLGGSSLFGSLFEIEDDVGISIHNGS